MRISAAVPSADEVDSLVGADLYGKGIQPVWLDVENTGDDPVRVALWSLDNDYFSPLEVAWGIRRRFSKTGRADMERWFHENQMPRRIPPGERRSGFVFTHVDEGTKGFNVDVYSGTRSYNFTFFVPLPGFRADYMDVDFGSLYSDDEIEAIDLDTLRTRLEGYDCCSTDESGNLTGDPFNVVFVSTGIGLRRALLRSDWQETAAGSPETELARMHRFRDRAPDATFHKERPDGSERKELRLWQAPMRIGDKFVWLGQVSYEMSGAIGFRFFEEYQIDPDVDDARMFLMQNFWYGQSLEAMGIAAGVPPASIAEPARNFLGDAWFTDGKRVVMVVSDEPVGMDEMRFLDWEWLDGN